MRKYTLLIFLFLLFFFASCVDEDYETDFDDNDVKLEYKDNKIVFENNSPYPIILDYLKINGKEVKNFIEYKVCDYYRTKNDVEINYSKDVNQIIYLSTILLPGKKFKINKTLKKKVRVTLLFYPVNYNFLSDNVFFLSKEISQTSKIYSLYQVDEVKNTVFITDENKESLTTIDGIMIYVKEYDILDDFLEEVNLELEE